MTPRRQEMLPQQPHRFLGGAVLVFPLNGFLECVERRLESWRLAADSTECVLCDDRLCLRTRFFETDDAHTPDRRSGARRTINERVGARSACRYPDAESK